MIRLDTAFLPTGIHITPDMFWLYCFSFGITKYGKYIFLMCQIIFLRSWGQISHNRHWQEIFAIIV
ncbi:Uncharacterised protein [Salmonella enterica subsp. enterica serovar Enteritidis]|nr:Uncharacterised protein [Salmonella enterica subsp. enterica serovar Enteritidis]